MTAFWLLEKAFASQTSILRTVLINNQPFQFSPQRYLRPIGWLIAVLFGLFYGAAMKNEWQAFALYFNQSAGAQPDPIFGKPIGFYLFSLTVYDQISSWLLTLAFVVLCAALAYAVLTVSEKVLKTGGKPGSKHFSAISIALAIFLVLLAVRTYLSRFPYLWTDHQVFSGITYTEANYLLPALFLVCIALLVAAAICLVNAFTSRGLRLLILAIALPAAVYVIGVFLV